ncbi:hypothetical protein [Ottowia sp.]|uniref:hypothetical protein n=1 Tax=Ottowia sp. TaxID=1898956 RepID=UPI002605F8D4|nr:hypothetical protein [Ottowia sp.]
MKITRGPKSDTPRRAALPARCPDSADGKGDHGNEVNGNDAVVDTALWVVPTDSPDWLTHRRQAAHDEHGVRDAPIKREQLWFSW